MTDRVWERIFEHSEESIRYLSRMQQDLFHGRIQTFRRMFGILSLIFAVCSMPHWWAFLFVFYGSFLLTGRYREADRRARKICRMIKESGQRFPCSRYRFQADGMHVFSMPENQEEALILYADVRRIAEDSKYFYVFRDAYGGYCIPKEAEGEKARAFRAFLEEKTGQKFLAPRIPALVFYENLRKKRGKKNSESS